MMPEQSENETSPRSISSSAATPARRTASPDDDIDTNMRISRLSSCGWLLNFARLLFCEKIQPSREDPPPGRGGDSGPNLSDLAMRCCPLDSGRVVLALTTDGIGCSCSPAFPTLIRSDATSGSDKRNRAGSGGPNLRAVLGNQIGASWAEDFMGFPEGWTDLEPSETLFTQNVSK